jgi:hypothetical protein
MTKKAFLIWMALFALLLFGVFLTVGALYGQQRVAKPDPKLTPGKVRTSDAKEICDPAFRTGPYRNTTSAMKRHVCAAYGVKDCPKEGAMELDHLLPLELGGLDDERNLWVQMAPEYHWKDLLENTLHAKVCKTHEMQLAEAQACIITDWAKCYEKHIGPLPKK